MYFTLFFYFILLILFYNSIYILLNALYKKIRKNKPIILTWPLCEYLVNLVPSTKNPNLCCWINSMISGVICSFSSTIGLACDSHSSLDVLSCCHKFVISAYVNNCNFCLNLSKPCGCEDNALVICSLTTLNTYI